MDITSLPNDVFLIIASYLSPYDVISNRGVSKAFQAAFSESELCRHLLQLHYPRARESRLSGGRVSWSDAPVTVVSRYHYLKAGKPRSIQKFAIGKSFVVPSWSRHYPIAKWTQHLHFEDKTAPFYYPDTLWTYEDGLLIFPCAKSQRYLLYDLGEGTDGEITFEPEGKIVRRINLKEKVLIIEWSEQHPSYQLGEDEPVHRHFVSAYDLVRDGVTHNWRTAFRNEWNMHFLGLPLNSLDRFLSCHSTSNYALYVWQPDRGVLREPNNPIEALAIWDISTPSQYRPSQDPLGKFKPSSDFPGPKLLKRLSGPDLDFYHTRQRSTPVLRGLELDENHVYFIEEDHRWLVGQQASQLLPRTHSVKTTGIPFAAGPRWEDRCGADGDDRVSFCERNTDCRGPNLAPCWRHEEFPYLTITEVVDAKSGVKFSARHCFTLETITISIPPNVHMAEPECEIALGDEMWLQLLGKGKICGDERWLIGENMNQEIVILHFDQRPGLSR